ncbi:biotin transporter BioY [Halobacteriales archaeon QS_1_68_17]|nr:MAG: biotin transporter BioY [Halobacteriales archaeon QS_1_68_17]
MSTGTGSVDLVGDETVENVARTALFAALVGAFAYVSFPNPFSTAPITLQVLGVFLAGIMLGPVWGGASMVLYLLAGALGAPVFSGGSAGVGALLGPTGGYLWSYPIAAAVTGVIVHGGLALDDPRRAGLARLVGGMVAGTAIIYALGIAGLMVVLGMGPVTAFVQGAAAFIPAEAFKIAAAVGIVRSDAVAAE